LFWNVAGMENKKWWRYIIDFEFVIYVKRGWMRRDGKPGKRGCQSLIYGHAILQKSAKI